MARMIPNYDDARLRQIRSHGERMLYIHLRDRLDATYVVYHSITWISTSSARRACDGEADFLVVHPTQGMLVIEVKGGGIRIDAAQRTWHSMDGRGTEHEIKDPFEQAKNAKYKILEKLKEVAEWSRLVQGRASIGHAVCFPDIANAKPLTAPDRPIEIMLAGENLSTVDSAVTKAMTYWSDTAGGCEIGKVGLAIIDKTFARSCFVKPMASRVIAGEEERRLLLTNEQYQSLRLLGRRRRVGIQGGAGTGKTLIAVTRAKELAANGMRTLLLCYNRPLSDHLEAVCSGIAYLEVANFHQFCERRFKQHSRAYLAKAKSEQSVDDLYDVQYPLALYLLLDEHPEHFDAILVDEAQDFGDEYWLPIQIMLQSEADSPLYLFYDLNQKLYKRGNGFPISPNDEFLLTTNCRNTKHIHRLIAGFYAGNDFQAPDIEGVDIDWVAIEGPRPQAAKIARIVTDYLVNGGLSAQDLVVIVTDRRMLASSIEALAACPLPRGIHWSDDAKEQSQRVRIVTAARFKGLEATVCLLWGMDSIDLAEDRMDIYVAASRPRNRLHVIASHAIAQILIKQLS